MGLIWMSTGPWPDLQAPYLARHEELGIAKIGLEIPLAAPSPSKERAESLWIRQVGAPKLSKADLG